MAGEVALLGPLDSVLERQGQTVIPRETESMLEEHPGVVQAICLKIKESEERDCLLALVQRVAEDPPEAEALNEWLGQRLHPAQLPNQLLMAPRFPHLPSGEVDRRRLQRHLQGVLQKKAGQ
jgi:long-chain acyl-CoA synthetase